MSFRNFLDFIPSNPKLVDKQKALNLMFFSLGADTDSQDIQDLLKYLRDEIIRKIAEDTRNNIFDRIGVLSYSLECLLRYRNGMLMKFDDVSRALDEIIRSFSLTIRAFKD